MGSHGDRHLFPVPDASRRWCPRWWACLSAPLPISSCISPIFPPEFWPQGISSLRLMRPGEALNNSGHYNILLFIINSITSISYRMTLNFPLVSRQFVTTATSHCANDTYLHSLPAPFLHRDNLKPLSQTRFQSHNGPYLSRSLEATRQHNLQSSNKYGVVEMSPLTPAMSIFVPCDLSHLEKRCSLANGDPSCAKSVYLRHGNFDTLDPYNCCEIGEMCCGTHACAPADAQCCGSAGFCRSADGYSCCVNTCCTPGFQCCPKGCCAVGDQDCCQ